MLHDPRYHFLLAAFSQKLNGFRFFTFEERFQYRARMRVTNRKRNRFHLSFDFSQLLRWLNAILRRFWLFSASFFNRNFLAFTFVPLWRVFPFSFSDILGVKIFFTFIEHNQKNESRIYIKEHNWKKGLDNLHWFAFMASSFGRDSWNPFFGDFCEEIDNDSNTHRLKWIEILKNKCFPLDVFATSFQVLANKNWSSAPHHDS
jgi:hypothetical protein